MWQIASLVYILPPPLYQLNPIALLTDLSPPCSPTYPKQFLTAKAGDDAVMLASKINYCVVFITFIHCV
jgi:hypothetical protein